MLYFVKQIILFSLFCLLFSFYSWICAGFFVSLYYILGKNTRLWHKEESTSRSSTHSYRLQTISPLTASVGTPSHRHVGKMGMSFVHIAVTLIVMSARMGGIYARSAIGSSQCLWVQSSRTPSCRSVCGLWLCTLSAATRKAYPLVSWQGTWA